VCAVIPHLGGLGYFFACMTILEILGASNVFVAVTQTH